MSDDEDDALIAEIHAKIKEERKADLQRTANHNRRSSDRQHASILDQLDANPTLDPTLKILIERRRRAGEQQDVWIDEKKRERLNRRQREMDRVRQLQDDLLTRHMSMSFDSFNAMSRSDTDKSSESTPGTLSDLNFPLSPTKKPPPPISAPPKPPPPTRTPPPTKTPRTHSSHALEPSSGRTTPRTSSIASLSVSPSSSPRSYPTPTPLNLPPSFGLSTSPPSSPRLRTTSTIIDESAIVGDSKLMFVQILVPKQFVGQAAGDQAAKANDYTEPRIAYVNFDAGRFEIWEKGANLVLSIEFRDMLGHNSDDNNPRVFHLYRDHDHRWTFHVTSMPDVTLMDSLLYAAEINDPKRLKNIQCYFSTQVIRKGTLMLKVQTMGGLTQNFHERSVTVITGKLLIYKKGCDVPAYAVSLYGTQIKHVKGAKEFDFTHQDRDTLTFRSVSAEDTQGWVSTIERALEMGDFARSLDIAPAELVMRVLHPEMDGKPGDESAKGGDTSDRLRTRSTTFDARITQSTSTLSANFESTLSAPTSARIRTGIIKNLSWRASKQLQFKQITPTLTPATPRGGVREEGLLIVVTLADNTWNERFVILKKGFVFIYPAEYMTQRREDQETLAYLNLQECLLTEDTEPLVFTGAFDSSPDQPALRSHLPPTTFRRFIWPIKFEDKDVMFVADTQEKQKMWREALKMCMDTVFQNQRSALLLGTVEELVTTLLNSSQIDPEYTAAFLHTFQSFMKPQDLLTSIEGRLFVSYDIDVAEIPETIWRKTVLKPTQQRCVHVLQQWMAVMAIDFIEEPGLLNATIELADRLAAEGLTLFADQLTESIKSVESTREGKREVAMLAKQKTAKMLGMDTPEAKIPKNIRNTITFMDCDPEEVARQLCVMDFKAYERIKPIELINRAWARSKRASAATDDDEPEASNVTSFIAQFNHISLYIANTICSVERLKERSIVYGRVVQLCGYLYHMQSFNMLKSCLAGMNMAPVFRLKHTKANLSKRVLSLVTEMETNMSSDKAHKRYREIIGEADAPCIPFLGVCLTDLTFVGDGNPNMVDGKHNFSKRKVAYGIISQFTKFQSSSFQFQPVIQIQNMLLNTTALKKEDELYSMSLALEPRGSKKSDILQ